MPRARVLAVDDQRYFRELIEGVLIDEGYTVVTAASGEEALHVLERADFEIVVTDLVMPKMDGVELVRRVKERKPDQEIVMVTGVSDVNSAISAMKQGATDYILKPLDGDLLARSLANILQRRRIADEHARLLAENTEFLGAMALYERAVELFTTMALQPLCERFIEGLCLQMRAQAGVLWTAFGEGGAERLELVAATGIIRVDDEPRELDVSQLEPELAPLASGGRPVVARLGAQATPGSALFVPLHQAGELIGLARLSDKLEGEDFSEGDKTLAQLFARFGQQAIGNALQFRDLERRSLRDVRTGAYTEAYFEDVVRNEIQKANRFGRPFSIVRLHLGDPRAMRDEVGLAALESWRESIVRRLGRVLRSTDLLCAASGGHLTALLPETDRGASEVLLRRMRDALSESDCLAPVADQQGGDPISMAAVTYPVDGTQLESLQKTLDASIAAQRTPEPPLPVPDGSTLAETIQGLVEQAEVVPAQLPSQVLDFLLDEAARRPHESGMLFVAPGSEPRKDLRAKLAAFDQAGSRTRVVVASAAEGPAGSSAAAGPVSWIPDAGLGTDRFCVLYCGERPAYALLAGEPNPGGESRVFHTSDRVLVEHLSEKLRRDLDGVPEFDLPGGGS